MSSHSPFECAAPKNVQFIRKHLCVSYQLHHQKEDGDGEQHQNVPLVI